MEFTSLVSSKALVYDVCCLNLLFIVDFAAIFIFLGISRTIWAQFEFVNNLPSHHKVLDDEEGLCPSGVHVLPGAIFEDEPILNNSLNAQT